MNEPRNPRWRFQLLGPVRIWRDNEELLIRSAAQRTILVRLALSPGKVFTRPEFVDALWGDSPPPSADGNVHTHLSVLRSVLEPWRAPRAAGRLLVSTGTGYRLDINEECIDLHRFHRLRVQAVERLATGQPLHALSALESALDLWHGEALGGLSSAFVRTQRSRLEELRLATREQRAEVNLALGHLDEMAAELRSLCQEHPLHEGLRALLMRALGGSGRISEALDVYADLRHTLLRRSGMEPATDLRALHQDLLDAVTESGRTTPENLPPTGPEHFSGREEELEILRRATTDVLRGVGGVVILDGEPGIGKTALLAKAFAEVAGRCAWFGWATAAEFGTTTPGKVIRDCLGIREPGPDAAAVLEKLGRRARGGPVVLVVDDFHHVDEVSNGLWRRIARRTAELPVLLVSAGRQVPRSPRLDRTRRELTGRSTSISLGPLGDQEMRYLAREAMGAPVPAAVGEALGFAAGNPRYALEILNGIQEGLPTRDGLVLSAPPALSARIAGHLAFLSPPAKSMVERASLLDDEFGFAELATTIGRPPLADVVAESLAAGIFTAVGTTLRFRHDVVRAGLYQGLPGPLRTAMHLEFAAALAAAGAPASKVAKHLAAVLPEALPDWASSWLIEHRTEFAESSSEPVSRSARHVVLTERKDSAW